MTQGFNGLLGHQKERGAMTQNYINHVALVLDASGSMGKHKIQLIKVADDQIKYLARRSQELDQETRVTVYMFADRPNCLIYDKDVLRLPSIASLYKTGGNTALIDATLLSQEDLSLISEKYGDHSFLTFVLTDGEENRSKRKPHLLAQMLGSLADNWTVAALVPNQRAKHEAKRFGFPADNIAIWDPNSEEGTSEAGVAIQGALDSYMVARSTGVRGTRTLFSTSKEVVNKQTVAATGLTPLSKSQFQLIPVPRDSVIKDFVEATGRPYVTGRGFYQLMKPETIQANKVLAVVENKTAKVFVGDGVRALVGLPDMEVRVRPGHNPDYTIFVQSTAINRKLIAGTKLLLLL
jgi:hypothetical protein